jgi:Tfp pilus assembly protein PilF
MRSRTTRVLSVAAALIVVSFAACAPAPDPVEDASVPPPADAFDPMAEALNKMQQGDGLAAAENLKILLAANPEHYGATYQIARALDMAGVPTEARTYWEKARVKAEQFQDTASLAYIQERLARPDTLSDEQRMTRGVDLIYRLNDPAGAAVLIREVVQRNPTHYGAHFQLATALERSGNAAESRQWWQKFERLAVAIGDSANLAVAREKLAAR